jgi:hypothetical protein
MKAGADLFCGTNVWVSGPDLAPPRHDDFRGARPFILGRETKHSQIPWLTDETGPGQAGVTANCLTRRKATAEESVSNPPAQVRSRCTATSAATLRATQWLKGCSKSSREPAWKGYTTIYLTSV